MREYLKKLGVAATVALGVLGVSVATSGSALAQRHGGGGGHAGGGWHGGGGHAGGGWHGGGGWRGGGWRGGWRGGGWRGGWGGWGWGPAFATGLAIGAWPYYYGGYYGPYAYGGCYRTVVINRWGHRVWRRVCY